jgi:hypothetical protein
VSVQHHPLAAPAHAGTLDAANGRYVLRCSTRRSTARWPAATTPSSRPAAKSTINDAGVPFTGHTEYLAERTHTPRVVMMLAGTGERPLRVALATTHLPLKDVSAALTIDGLVDTLRSSIDLRRISASRAAHPRDGAEPARRGERLSGPRGNRRDRAGAGPRERARHRCARPYPADTLFQPRYLAGADCVLAMFHDQGLPVLKYATFGEGINVTLGLPIIRTRSTMAPRWTWPAPAAPIRAAWSPRSTRPSRWRAIAAHPDARSPTSFVALVFSVDVEQQTAPGPLRAQALRAELPRRSRRDRLDRRDDRPVRGQRMVEIGPGLGALTEPLIARVATPSRRCTWSSSTAT